MKVVWYGNVSYRSDEQFARNHLLLYLLPSQQCATQIPHCEICVTGLKGTYQSMSL
jgi:hypothetical protein